MGWTIRHRGVDYELRAPSSEEKRSSTLLADGVEVDTQTATYWESSTLTHDGAEFKVSWGPTNKVKACQLVETLPDPERPDDPDAMKKELTELEPPPGSRAAKVAAFRREHPGLYASRRILVALLEVAATILGLGLLFGKLLPSINWSWLPDISKPDWLRKPDWWPDLPDLPLPDLPDLSVPGWLADAAEWFGDTKKFWLPIVIAIFAALGEVDRRRKKEQARLEREAAHEAAAESVEDAEDDPASPPAREE